MKLALIVAVAENGVIGQQNALPWRLPEDLKHFKALTLGKPVIMGRKTFDSIGKPLPGRTNIVITRQSGLAIPGCVVVPSLPAALAAAGDAAGGASEAMVIGGAEIYAQALPQAQRIYLTRVHAWVDGDAFFPDIAPPQWREMDKDAHAADERHAQSFTFLTYERQASA